MKSEPLDNAASPAMKSAIAILLQGPANNSRYKDAVLFLNHILGGTLVEQILNVARKVSQPDHDDSKNISIAELAIAAGMTTQDLIHRA